MRARCHAAPWVPLQLSGQTNEAFWNSVQHAKPFAVGLNCALGAADMKKYVANLSQCADCYVFCYPNAGLPNAMGGYDQKGDAMAEEVRPFCEEGLVNALGGCCGTGYEHIAAIKQMASAYKPRQVREGRGRAREDACVVGWASERLPISRARVTSHLPPLPRCRWCLR